MLNAPFILMLEDDHDDQHIAKTFFDESEINVRVEFLVNAGEVLPYLETCIEKSLRLPDIVLLDKGVPAGGSMDVLKKLKSHYMFKLIPVVIIGNSAFPGEVYESYEHGANSYILKPLTNKQTANTIENFLIYWCRYVQMPEISLMAKTTE